MPSLRLNDDDSDALSMRTLTESTYSPTDGYFVTRNHPPRVLHIEEPEVAKKESPRPPSLSQSSFFSSPPVSAQWTPDSSSEFSVETSALLGVLTPPPYYSSTRQSVATRYVDEPETRSGREPYEQRTLSYTHHQHEIQIMSNGSVLDTSHERPRARSEHMRRMFGKIVRCGMTVCMFAVLFAFLRSWYRPLVRLPKSRPAPPSWVQDCPGNSAFLDHHELSSLTEFHLSDTSPGSFSGTIKVLPALHDQTVDLIIKLRPGVSSRLTFNSQRLSPPTISTKSLSGSSCTPADVTLHFHKDLILENLKIRTESGTILIHTPHLQVSNSTSMSTSTGNIDTGALPNSRKTYIDTGSSSLKGIYPLYDVLSITSASGSVDITVDPQPASDENSNHPARLLIISQSGSVKVNLLTVDIPNRQYHTVISSTSGTVSGTLIHGHSTTVSTQSSSLDISLRLFAFSAKHHTLPEDNASILTTTSTSGSHTIRLLSSVTTSKQHHTTHMKSTHTAESGRLALRYPAEWEGSIRGSTESGSLNLRGDGVRIIERRNGYVVAEKGDRRQGSLVFASKSGSADVGIGH